MLIDGKVAVIYGAGGAIGGAVARAFAAEGARLFLTGRTRAGVDAVGKDISAAGGFAETAEIDALDEQAVDGYLRYVAGRAGRIDISCDAIGLAGTGFLGVPLTELDAEKFAEPITTYTMSYFLTARLAARRMIPNKSGVIMTVTGLPAKAAYPLNGGYGASGAAREQLTRDLSLELAPHGIRVVGLRPNGLPESRLMRELYDARDMSITWDQFQEYLANSSHPRRNQTLKEVADTAVFLASDLARGLTGTTVNLSMGAVSD